MTWTTPLDYYCERLGPGLWAEPLNAITNLAFLWAAWLMWRRVRGRGLPLAVALCAVLAAIGVGSTLFHTFATPLASLFDVGPIGVFILIYILAAGRDLVALPLWAAGALTAAFLPFARLIAPLFLQVPVFATSAFYMPVPVAILAFAATVARRAPATARGLVLGAALLLVSLVFRGIDRPLCTAFAPGTHFLWHLTNAGLLAWMIEVYRRHMLAHIPRRG